MGYMNRAKARDRMAERGLDALLIAAPDNLLYTTGFPSLLANMWQEAGISTAWALVPQGAGPLAMVVPDTERRGAQAASSIEDVRDYPIWVDSDAIPADQVAADDIPAVLRSAPSAASKPAQRPGFFDPYLILGALTDLLRDRGLLEGRIGIELDFVSQLTYGMLRERLPDVTFVDSGDLLRDLRVVKSAVEIEHIRNATWLAEQGILGATASVRDDTRHGDIRLQFQLGAAQAVATRATLTGFQGAGASVRVGPNPWVSTPGAVVQPGDQVMFDCGATVHGYHSDIGRTFSFRKATGAQQRIQSALVAAHDAALRAVRPGNRFCDIYNAGMDAMHRAGYETYRRGHLGHSVGIYMLEEKPIISAAETRPLEPDMVLAVELPWYIDGLGGFQCEDIVRVTADGYENFNALARELVVI